MISQIIRFTLRSHLTISAGEFLTLRQKVAATGAVTQYYGYTLLTRTAPLPKKRHEVCWVVHWPESCERHIVMNNLGAITTGDETSLLLKFTDAQLKELENGLNAPICEFACIQLADNAPIFDAALQESMDKTYTDTYKLLGFTGGSWAYVLNANNSAGVSLGDGSENFLLEQDRRLGLYVLGWESIELHQDATETSIFAEEMGKLRRYFSRGTGAWYVSFRRH